jgi:colanic acid biosynthesis glycosyl transferase WcaI
MAEKLRRDDVEASKIALIPNWAEESRVDAEDTARVRRAMDWNGHYVVMHAGNAGLAQNLDVLIDSTKHLREEPDIVVAFVGDGAAKKGLEQRARVERLSNVQFIEHVPKPEAERLIAAADLHVISLVPGLWGCVVPSKLYGILAAGKPFIAAVDPESEPARLAIETGCGIVVPPGDSVALAEAIRRLRRHPDPTMGEAGRRAFRAEYRRDRASRAYGELLEALVSTTAVSR